MKTSFLPTDATALRGITPRQITTRLGRIEYADFGSGPVVVALHGALGGWDQSAILAKCALDSECRVIALSRPGYLGTPLASGRTPSEQADLVSALLERLGIARAVLIAISGGGPCALAFALRHPDRCGGLVLISTCSVPNTARIPLRFHLIKAAARLPFLARRMQSKALARFDKTMARSIRDAATVQRLLGEPEVLDLYVALTASAFDRLHERLPGTENDIRITFSTQWPLEELRVPTLVIHGTEDRVAPFAVHALPFASRIPAVRFVPVQGGEHVTLFTHRSVVQASLRAFLTAAAPERSLSRP